MVVLKVPWCGITSAAAHFAMCPSTAWHRARDSGVSPSKSAGSPFARAAEPGSRRLPFNQPSTAAASPSTLPSAGRKKDTKKLRSAARLVVAAAAELVRRAR